jgi:hypothetical protein
VATSVAAGTSIPFALALTDRYGNAFSVQFSYVTH